MSDHNDIFEVKSPEQLSIDDVVPAWDTDFVVQNVLPVKGNSAYLVTFTNGNMVEYQVGVAIKVRK